jgi:hypothetical protein
MGYARGGISSTNRDRAARCSRGRSTQYGNFCGRDEFGLPPITVSVQPRAEKMIISALEADPRGSLSDLSISHLDPLKVELFCGTVT